MCVAAALALLAGLVAAAAVLAASPASYLAAHRHANGGFAEPGGNTFADLTGWATLGLVAAGKPPDRLTASYLRQAHVQDTTDAALVALALTALGREGLPPVAEYLLTPRADGSIGALVNSTIWGVLALRAASRPVPAATVRYLLRQQRPSGGWSWYPRGMPDSNDTAAAIQALRAVGTSGKPIARGLSYLRSLERKDGGFALARGRGSDSQSTAWAIQAFIAAGKKPPAAAFRFLGRMRRPDGSYRYSTRYAVTPVWVTAQVLPALARKSFPLG
jgi:Prenyltransferase and squalene oxidase repeat